MKKIYIVRHCEAEGQSPNAKLTEQGLKQALGLSDFFSDIKIGRIISSPFERAIQSIQPFAQKMNINIEIEKKLTERVLTSEVLLNWKDMLRATFENHELKLVGGESSQEAKERIISVVEKVSDNLTENTIIVTHGNLMSLLLNNYNKNFSFKDWQHLSNPDIYVLKEIHNKVIYERLWNQNSFSAIKGG